MANGRTAEWYQMDDNWVVWFDASDGVYPDPYLTSDFQDAMDVVAAWVNDGKLPEEML